MPTPDAARVFSQVAATPVTSSGRCTVASPVQSRLLPSPAAGCVGRGRLVACCGGANGNGLAAASLSVAWNDEMFVRSFRESRPYIRAHKACTFVVVIAGEVVDGPHLDAILQDISLLRDLGIKFVLVPGTHVQIDKLLSERGKKATYAGRYRITDSDSLQAAMEAAGRIRLTIEAKLSPSPPMLNLGRHGANGRCHEVGVNVASGNFLGAKRKGIVDGVDYGFTGEVKKIDVMRIKESLDNGSVVIVSNMGYSSSGEVLNCNTYEVATACALAIKADKLICIIDGQILDENGRVTRFLSLKEADMLIRKRAKLSDIAANYVKAVGMENLSSSNNFGLQDVDKETCSGVACSDQYDASFQNGVGFNNGDGIWSSKQGFAIGGEECRRHLNGYLSELAAAAYVCHGGVQRVHIIDGTADGALLLELFTRDGVGTMISRDLYEGTRKAKEEDLQSIRRIIKPLEEAGSLIRRTDEELLEAMDSFVVVERDGHVIACAALFPFFKDKCGEVAAIAVSGECRGEGQGHKILEYIEKKALSMGLQRLFLLTTRTADWFVRRGYRECTIDSLPAERRERINLSRGSKYYMKSLIAERPVTVSDSGAAGGASYN